MNYGRDNHNRFISEAARIYEYLSGNYLNELSDAILQCSGNRFSLGKMKIVEICGYRMLDNTDNTISQMRQLMSEILGICYSANSAFAYIMTYYDGKLHIFYAYEADNGVNLDSLFRNRLPDIIMKNGFLSPSTLNRLAQYGGVVTGNVLVNLPSVDQIINTLVSNSGIICYVCRPCETDITDNYESELTKLKQQTDYVLSDSFSSKYRVNSRDGFSGVKLLNNYVNNVISNPEANKQRTWMSCVWVTSSSKNSAIALGTSIAGVMNSNSDITLEKSRFFLTDRNPFMGGVLWLPNDTYCQYSEIVPLGLRKPSLVALISSDFLAGIMQLPLKSYSGFGITDFSVDENSLQDFPTRHTIPDSGEYIEIGEISNTGERYRLAIKDINEHILVTGATGSGKSNTVMYIITQIYHKNPNLPFCIIEPANSNYWKLIASIPELQVCSVGHDANPIHINPFIPEEGVYITNHIENIMLSLESAFDMEEPTRLAFHGLIEYTYEKMGWHGTDRAICSRKFPCFKDAENYLDEFCDNNLSYGNEVNNNVKGSLKNRLKKLNSGLIGEVINSNHNISGKDICSGHILFDLNGITPEGKAFISSMLVTKIVQYAQRRGSTNYLQNVVVLEEAHNVFSRNSSNSSDRTSSAQFSNMISQIRSSGIGMIVVDQGASEIDEKAIANTKIKITHAVSYKRDVEELRLALGLSDYQADILPALFRGEAIIGIKGVKGSCRVKIDKTDDKPIKNCACVICNERRGCFVNRIESVVIQRKCECLVAAEHLYNERLDTCRMFSDLSQLNKRLGLSSNDMECLLGYLLGMLPNMNESDEIKEAVCSIREYMSNHSGGDYREF